MYLKSLEIQGFKSFANKFTLQFDTGITGIVGPNGSGKSNISDAVRWVLGEQSAKQLRGSNMQDIIFSGTENRKPLGLASVSITLDNRDHRLSLDYEEVTVTRRVYRSGESEYLLNGASCRLRDIQELFYDTGIGKEGYSIIGQGQIDRILSGKPEERRELFDEAAGIVKFKRRKAAAQKKLEEEHRNLTRVQDILSEISRQLTPLQRQAEQAKAYLKCREELRTCEVSRFLLDEKQFTEQLARTQEDLQTVEGQLAEAHAAQESTRQEYEEQDRALKELDTAADDAKETMTQCRMQVQQLTGRTELLREQIRAAQIQKQNAGERTDVIRNEKNTRQTQRAQEEETLALLQRSLEETQKERQEVRLEQEKAAASLSLLERQIEEGKNSLLSLVNERGALSGRQQRYHTMQEQMQLRKAEISAQILKRSSEDASREETLHRQQEACDAATKRIEELRRLCAFQQTQLEALEEALAQDAKETEERQTAYHRETSRLESLINLTERYDGYGNSIRKVMERREEEPGILGVAADLFQVEKTYETAIETALGGNIQNIVTDDEATARRMIEYLKKNRFGRATFLPLTAVHGQNSFHEKAALQESGVIGLASTLVQTEECYRPIAAYLLGRTLVVDQVDHALAAARKYQYRLRLVTLEGESLSPGGSITGGAFRSGSNLLGRRREIAEREAAAAAQKKELEALRARTEKHRSERDRLRDTITEQNGQLQKACLEQNTLQVNLSRTKKEKEQAAAEHTGLKAEQKDIEQQIAQTQQEKEQITAKLSASADAERQLQNRIEGWQKEQEEERKKQQMRDRKASDLDLSLSGARQSERFSKQTISRIDKEIGDLSREERQIEEKQASADAQTEEKENEIRDIQAQIAQAQDDRKAAEERLAALQQQREEKNERQKQIFARQEALAEEISDLEKESYRLKSREEKVKESREAQISALWEEYELTPSMARDQCSLNDASYDGLKTRIEKLKVSIREFGDVNVTAVEEFRKLSERHTFLSTQHDDLVRAEAALQNVITQLDTGMREQFQENFARIRQEFDKAFRQLFGGGKGSLSLVECEDILEAGIQINVQPPGKKLQNMMQLSGGEKALTAIALLFAIQQLKPSPFCLLDEIEAALDEGNVTRYANYLRKLTKQTQFILITHRRGTMAAADRLYGITMQEKGVSALVSVNLSEEDLK